MPLVTEHTDNFRGQSLIQYLDHSLPVGVIPGSYSTLAQYVGVPARKSS